MDRNEFLKAISEIDDSDTRRMAEEARKWLPILLPDIGGWDKRMDDFQSPAMVYQVWRAVKTAGSDIASGIPYKERLVGTIATLETQAGKKKQTRDRGPSEDKLEACREAMGYWLDQHKTETEAADLAGISKDTMNKWVPNVLSTVDDETHERWITELKALGKGKLLQGR